MLHEDRWERSLEYWTGVPVVESPGRWNGYNLWKATDFLRSHVERQDNGCILFTGGSRRRGYGNINWKCDYTGKTLSIRAHRLSYFLANREMPFSSEFVCHTCHNPLCVNPEHLWVGTPKENSQDMVKAGRSLDMSGSRNHNSKLTPQQRDEIVALRKDGRTYKSIAQEYGLHLSTIAKVCKRWKTNE